MIRLFFFAGVEMKITNVRVATKTKGFVLHLKRTDVLGGLLLRWLQLKPPPSLCFSYQGLTDCSSPEVFEQFPTVHLCNYYCGLLGLRPLKTQDQQQTTKVKGSRSPLLNRKVTTGSGSPQPHRKGHSPQMARKSNMSPKVTRTAQVTEHNDSNGKLKVTETTDPLEIR